MADNVHYLTPQQGDIGHFFRLGHTGYRILENLHAAGRLPIRRAIIDACHIEKQTDLISSLKDTGVELILDTKAAELSFLGGYSTSAQRLPWAHKSRHHQPPDFTKPNLIEFCEKIAGFAVAHQLDVVHSATHTIQGSNDPWLDIDINICIELRKALDRCGGQRIQIDYPLIIPYSLFLREKDDCNTIANKLQNLPFTNLWLRVSGFGGMKATPAGLSRYVQSAWMFRALKKPIIADGVAGLIGVSLAAFGAIGGICHGVAEKENFNLANWKKPSTSGGGSRKRIYFPEIDLYLYDDQARTLLQGRNSKSLLACNDISCCAAHGYQNMFEQHKAHALTQSTKLITQFNQTPESRWVDFLMNKHIEPVGRTLRKVEKIKLSDPKLMETIKKQSHRFDLLYQSVEQLHKNIDEKPRSLKPILRHIDFPSLGRIG